MDALKDPAAFTYWLRAVTTPATPALPLSRVTGCRTGCCGWTRGSEYLGRVRVNLALNEELRSFRGHIGYDVRPAATPP